MQHNVCRDFLAGRCHRDHCKFSHEIHSGTNVEKNKAHNKPKPNTKRNKEKYNQKRPKNTENFKPLARPVDMRIVYDLGKVACSTALTSRDVLVAPNMFSDFAPGELYAQLEDEINNCGVPPEQLLKLWHGDTHLIADDHTNWKKNAPTFAMVTDRIRTYFNMDIKATRFNWYKDTSNWKPFHHDASAIKKDKADIQNFTVGVSFGATRDAAFEEARTKVTISMPQPDGCAYCFAKDTNILWKHGILKEKETRDAGRISIICWGWVDGIANTQ